jgi:uncharacterized protein (DUF885 family)
MLSWAPVLLAAGPGIDAARSPAEAYIKAWRAFYPSRAFAYGDVAAADAFEDYSPDRLARWLRQNRETVAAAKSVLESGSLDTATRTDLSVLQAGAEDELARWVEDQPLSTQPQWYAEQVSQALTHLLVREQLPPAARSQALIERLRGVRRLCRLGVERLRRGNRQRTETALRTLAGSRRFYGEELPALTRSWPPGESGVLIDEEIALAVTAIAALEAWLREEILPGAQESPAIGAQIYAQKLSRRTSGSYTPQRLREAAAAEVAQVRRAMVDEAQRWRASLPAPAASRLAELRGDALLSAAIDAMEADRDDSQEALLNTFSRLTLAAERFVEERRIATVPKPTTLLIDLSPEHFSGAAVGGVYESGPFDPRADTLFYVPSVPDSAPADAREGFYRSFNTHFNTMIISHEMFPGHYLQYKVATQSAPALRALFANGAYVEGWGSFAEELMLDAGWADNAALTRLAHLRKRLENATRAYVSVQVNSAGWGQEEVLAFASDEGLLAPQFATNLWQRVVNSPLQITDYFTGYREFRRLYADFRARRPDAPTRRWVDRVLRAGPLPLALLEPALASGDTVQP